MFRADGKANGTGADSLGQQLLLGELGMGGGGRVDDQGFDVRHVGQQREQPQVVNKPIGRRLPAPDIKGKNGAPAPGEILLVQRVVRVGGQSSPGL